MRLLQAVLLLASLAQLRAEIPLQWEIWAQGAQRSLLQNGAPGPAYAPPPPPINQIQVTFYDNYCGGGDLGSNGTVLVKCQCTSFNLGFGITDVSPASFSSTAPDLILYTAANCATDTAVIVGSSSAPRDESLTVKGVAYDKAPVIGKNVCSTSMSGNNYMYKLDASVNDKITAARLNC